MAHRSFTYNLELKDYLILGLHKVMTEINGKVLRRVLLWGTPRRQKGQAFKEYLFTMKNISGVIYRKGFNKSQRDKMENDPETDSYDVSLLYQCIQYGCDGLAPPKDPRWVDREDTLERRLTSVKTHRNDLMHEEYQVNKKNYLDKIEEIRNLLTDIIQKAAKEFKRNETEINTFLNEINDELNYIRDQCFNAFPSDFIHEQLSNLFKIEGRIELQNRYKAESSMSPISNLLGKNIKVQVKKIFTKIEIQRANDQELVEVESLFEYVDLLNSSKNVLLVEGVAGAGKTTLTRLILQEWAGRSNKMKNLDNYDLAIWTECRDGGTPSLAHLLHSLMPTATQKVQGDAEVVKCLHKNELLFLVDGLDELNASSERVFREILALENTDIITIICTTRPNKAPDIKRYVSDTFEILHVKIIGIAEKDREEFVRNYCQALESQVGKIDISGLLHYLRRKESRLQEHWRLPFNLVLVTILWLQDPTKVNEMTTATELFVKTFELCKERLIQRLHDNETTSRLSNNDIDQNLTLCIEVMAKIAFVSHYNDETILSETSLQNLKTACQYKTLPPEEVMSSFLVQAVSLVNKNLQKFSFPHKGLQDFFCAIHIEQALEHKDTNFSIQKILSSVEHILIDNTLPRARITHVLDVCNKALTEIQGESSSTSVTVQSIFEEALRGAAITNPNQAVELDLGKWRNILLHLTGLLHYRGRLLTDKRAEEMVKLIGKSGITDSTEWFDFLSNVKCDAAISKHIIARGDIEVNSARLEAFLKIMHHAEPNTVKVNIEGNPSATPCLEEFLIALRKKDWEVWLYLHHDFQFPKEGGSVVEDTLRKLFRSNLRLRGFKGQLSASALKELPSGVFDLHLSVKDSSHFLSMFPLLTSREERVPRMEKIMMKLRGRTTEKRLRTLYIHVPVDIEESSLRPLPRGSFLRLYVSGVAEETAEKASVVARTLQPSGGRFRVLYFPGVLRTPRVCDLLVEKLGHRDITIEGAVAMSPAIDEGEKQRMETLVRRKLSCKFGAFSEDDIWNIW